VVNMIRIAAGVVLMAVGILISSLQFPFTGGMITAFGIVKLIYNVPSFND